MLKDLFVHVCIVVTFLFIGGSIARSKPIVNPLYQKILLGSLAGVLGSILMIFSIHVTPTILMDLRYFAVLLSALYGGYISILISVIIIACSRVLFFHGTAISLLIAVIQLVTIGIFSAFIIKLRVSDFKKWIYMNVFSWGLIIIGYLYQLDMSKQVYTLLVNYTFITLMANLFVFYVADYKVKSNRMFNQIKQESKTDFLTGLNNVRQFDSALNIYIEKARERGEKLSLLYIDIDHFKKVNDTYGHNAGDEVLKQLGGILFSLSRSFDLVSRNGGEEFSVLLLNCPHTQAMEIGEHIRQAVENHEFILPDGKKLKVTISMGVSTFMETTDCPNELLQQADDALYKAKRTGRNKVCSMFLVSNWIFERLVGDNIRLYHNK